MNFENPLPALQQHLLRRWRGLAFCAGLVGGVLGAVAPAQAAQQFSPYSGQGNLSVFDAAAGTGGWVGSLQGLVHPLNGDPFDLVSVVLFSVDGPSRTLSGQFEWTGAFDLGSSLFGRLTGTVSDDDILLQGGQFALDYLIDGGTGVFSGAGGFGLAFVDFDPLASGDNYREAGLVVASVPVPNSMLLAMAALVLMAALHRRQPEGRSR
ncbi:MAG TPA: hypothetical protein PLA97_24525 [Rubrivivax sp.]|nr:hypothetical protein [Rubrivivax sp.]